MVHLLYNHSSLAAWRQVPSINSSMRRIASCPAICKCLLNAQCVCWTPSVIIYVLSVKSKEVKVRDWRPCGQWRECPRDSYGPQFLHWACQARVPDAWQFVCLRLSVKRADACMWTQQTIKVLNSLDYVVKTDNRRSSSSFFCTHHSHESHRDQQRHDRFEKKSQRKYCKAFSVLSLQLWQFCQYVLFVSGVSFLLQFLVVDCLLVGVGCWWLCGCCWLLLTLFLVCSLLSLAVDCGCLVLLVYCC